MKVLWLSLLGAALLHAAPMRLEPGEYRWLPLAVKRVPIGMDCQFRVLNGGATVHMEVLAPREVRNFRKGREYSSMASAAAGRDGEIRIVIDEPGEYGVLVGNDEHAAPATVNLDVRTELNPARALSPQRRLTVIVISFAIFFGLATWSGWRLLRATRVGQPQTRK
jgi:hypothetical protein